MKAVIIENIPEKGDFVSIEGEEARHLIKVSRTKMGEEILLLNGNGLQATSKVSELFKDRLVVEVQNVNNLKSNSLIDLMIMVPKKDFFEEIIRSSVELGINSIYPVKSAYSQTSVEENVRLKRIMESAVIQSNNPFTPKIYPMREFDNISELIENYDHVFYFSSQSKKEDGKKMIRGKALMIIGPEGGLSPLEEQYLFDHKKVTLVHFKGPILRAVTAVPSAYGYIYGLFDFNN